MKTVSIVVPVYNEQDNIQVFYKQVCKYLEPLNYQFEIVFIDDGSNDLTPVLLDELCRRDARVRAILLAKNSGHQVAITCGMEHADGDAVVTMDGDMQHPPELIPVLLEQWEQGYEIVQTIRESTEDASWFKNLTSKSFYRLINKMSELDINEGGSDFRLLDRKVVLAFRRFKERARFIRGMVSSIGFKQTNITFMAPKRFAGKSKFSLHKMLHFALDGITAYSRFPLRMAFYVGLCMGLFSLSVLAHVLFIKFFTDDIVPGWATLVVTISFLGGSQLVCLGIIGEYIGRIFEEVKQRPLYLVREELGTKKIGYKQTA